MSGPIPLRVVPSVAPDELSPRAVTRAFEKALDDGLDLQIGGEGRHDPDDLVATYRPKFRVRLFDTTFYLTKVRQNEDIRFFVAYLVQGGRAFARLLYKDVSLVWRSASHVVRSEGENWIGKGDVQVREVDGDELIESDEATTDLPLEMQTAVESLIARSGRLRRDDDAPVLVLRGGPDDRVQPYRDFSEPRRRAWADPRNRIHGGRRVARFRRRTDPTSLAIAKGYEPDFRRGVLEVADLKSRLYGGLVRRHRVLSRNMRVQYGFFAGPRQVWIGTLQGTAAELSSFGVRTVDVATDEDVLLPGYEYHFLDDSEDPPEFVSQIPKGFAGPPSEVDASRADASPWLDRVPVIRAFRREVLGKRRG